MVGKAVVCLAWAMFKRARLNCWAQWGEQKSPVRWRSLATMKLILQCLQARVVPGVYLRRLGISGNPRKMLKMLRLRTKIVACTKFVVEHVFISLEWRAGATTTGVNIEFWSP